MQLEVSDQLQLKPLTNWLRGIPDLRVTRGSGTLGPGEQGAWDFLIVLASGSGVLGTAIMTLPEFIRSRRSGFTIRIKTKGKEVTLTADNVDETMPVLGRLLDD